MEKFFPKCFFDLTDSIFEELFNPEKPVWEALKKLIDFVDKRASSGHKTVIPSYVHVKNPELIAIGNNCIFHPGAYLQGPCVLGDDVEIGHCAFIRPYSVIGKGSVVGHCSEIKQSLLLEKVKVPHFNYVGDSILGKEVSLGSSAVCANLKLSKQEIFITYKGEKISTGLAKMGAIIGDHSFLGCHAVTNPGTLLRKKFLCIPGSILTGCHLERSL